MAAQKIAVVTGAGSGVGKAAAVALSRDGFTIVLAGRRADKLHEVAGELDGASLVVPTDVREPASIAALFAKVKEAYGRLDLLFNNAGVSPAACRSRRFRWSAGSRWSPPTSPVFSCARRKRSRS